MYVPSVGADFAVFVRQLVRAGFEHLGDYVRSFPWRRELVAAPVVLSKPHPLGPASLRELAGFVALDMP